MWKFIWNESYKPSCSHLTIKELEESTVEIVKLVQGKYFANELRAMNNHENFDNLRFDVSSRQVLKHSPLRKLCLVVVKGVLQLGGRFLRADLPIHTMFPILLPSRSLVTSLIIGYCHIRDGHAGVMQTLSSLRVKFWVINGISSDCRVLRECRIAFAKPGMVKLCHRYHSVELHLVDQLSHV